MDPLKPVTADWELGEKSRCSAADWQTSHSSLWWHHVETIMKIVSTGHSGNFEELLINKQYGDVNYVTQLIHRGTNDF